MNDALVDWFKQHEVKRPLPLVIDTDAANQIDDQFAITYAVLAQDEVDLQACYAAPFAGRHNYSAEQGMEAAAEEIQRVLDTMGDVARNIPVISGARSFIGPSKRPQASDAAWDLIKRSKELEASGKGPLYVAAIGAITNVASAIMLDPTVIERIRVVWLAGQPLYWPDAREYNMTQDPKASRIILDQSADLLLLPCKHVVEQLRTTEPELAMYLRKGGDIGKYLYTLFADLTRSRYACSKPIWDLAAIASLVCPEAMLYDRTPAPILTEEFCWSFDPERHQIRVATDVNRDLIFADFFKRLARHGKATVNTANSVAKAEAL